MITSCITLNNIFTCKFLIFKFGDTFFSDHECASVGDDIIDNYIGYNQLKCGSTFASRLTDMDKQTEWRLTR